LGCFSGRFQDGGHDLGKLFQHLPLFRPLSRDYPVDARLEPIQKRLVQDGDQRPRHQPESRLRPARVDTYPGADQIGALLLARALHDLNGFTPAVFVVYSRPDGANTIPRYEDLSLDENVTRHIRAVGGRRLADPAQADLILFVHAPDGPTAEAAAQEKIAVFSPRYTALAQKLASLAEAGPPVAVADTAYANGADDAQLRHLADAGLLPRLGAYAGWNTAGNSIGTALAHGTLYSFFRQRDGFSREAHLECLLTRLVENWGYQTRVRPEIVARYPEIHHGGTPVPAEMAPEVLHHLETALHTFTETWLAPCFPDLAVRATAVSLPWNRLLDVRFRLTYNDQ